MTNRTIFFSLVLGIVLLGGSAHATDLTTPLVSIGDTGSAQCNVLNTTASPVQITKVQLLDASGGEIDSSLESFVLAGGNGWNIGFSTNRPTPLYCKVSTSASRRSLRVSIVVNDATGTSMVGLSGD